LSRAAARSSKRSTARSSKRSCPALRPYARSWCGGATSPAVSLAPRAAEAGQPRPRDRPTRARPLSAQRSRVVPETSEVARARERSSTTRGGRLLRSSAPRSGNDAYGDEALVRCRAMRAAVARLLAPGDQTDPGGLPSGEFEPVPAQALAKNLQTLPAAELRLPRKAGRSPDRRKIRVAARKQVCAFTTQSCSSASA
jgi:hypothetical protein